MKKRCLAIILVLVMCLSMLPVSVVAAEGDKTVVRVQDGTITKGDLWNALGCTEYVYHYCKIDEEGNALTGWKRLESKSDTAVAELIEDQGRYKLESRTWWSETFDKDWKDAGTFQVQYYHKLTVTTEELYGGTVTVGGESLQDAYEVNAGGSITFQFSSLDGYEPQINVGNTTWVTVYDGSYTISPKVSNDIKLRYVEAAEDQCSVTISINNESLGTCSGLEKDRVASGTRIDLTVTPYNELTSSNDKDAYVKSVIVNGKTLTGGYHDTVFTVSFEVTENTTVEIEFAKRLVLKTPTVYEQKYEGDPKTYMYSAKMNMDKKVSAQVDAIEQSIIESVVDVDNTPGAENIQIQLKGELSIIGTLYKELDEYVLNNIHWGDRTFHNDDENWEEIRLVLPATEDGRYPEVQTEDLTVWIQDIREVLTIDGNTNKVVVESEENIDASIKAAVREKILKDNPGATIAKIGESNISYSYTTPEFSELKAETETDVVVNVTVAREDYYLDSTGIITVPLCKSDEAPKVTVNTDGNGKASYTISDDVYGFVLTPKDGYYVKSIKMTDQPESGESVSDTITPDQMTVYEDGKFSYTYDLTVEMNHSYQVYVKFVKYEISVSAKDGNQFFYYEGKYADVTALTAALEEKLEKEVPSLPNGTMYLEYQAGTDQWLTIGTELPDDSCHNFGKNNTEQLRYRYVFTGDGFEVISNTVTLEVTDGRIPTEVKIKTDSAVFTYEEYEQKEDKSAFLLETFLDGVYTVGDGAALIEDAVVTLSKADELESGITALTLQFAGDTEYMSSDASVTLELTPKSASVSVTVTPTTVTYGTEYAVDVNTAPEDLDTIRFVMGVDLKETSIQEKVIPFNLTIIGTESFRNTLQSYAMAADTDDQITAMDVLLGMQGIFADEEAMKSTGVSKAALEKFYEMLMLNADYLIESEVIFSDTLPVDTGFYVAGAIVAERGYDVAVSVNYLTITPKNIKAELDWKKDIENKVTFEQMADPEHMGAKVSSVESGSIEDAEKQLVSIYLGLNDDGELDVIDPSDMTIGVYTQVAFLKEWISNEQYAAVPIMRDFALGADYAEVQFIDEDKNPTDIYYFNQNDEIKTPVMVNGKETTENLTIINKELYAISGTVGTESTEEPVETGLYWLSATYQKQDDKGTITMVGKDSALLVISMEIDGFEPKDTKVPYDGEEKFIRIDQSEDRNTMQYLSVIVDKANKKINILLPDSMKGVGNVLGLVREYSELMNILQEYSPDKAQEMALLALLKQVQTDMKNITGWTVSIDGAKPSQVGTYGVYVMTIGDGLYLCQRTLEIEKSDPVYTAPKGCTLTYNGSAQNLIIAGSTADGTMEYSLDGENWSADIPTGIDATTYTVKYRVIGDENHKNSQVKDLEVTIAPLDIADAQIQIEKDPAYNGSEQTVNITSVKMGTLDVAYEVTEGNSGTNADTYTLKIKGTGNYTGTAEKDWKIEKADASYTAPKICTLIYNGSAQNLITAGSTADGIMEYSLDGENWSADIPTGTDATTYTVKYRVIGDENHKDSQVKDLEVTIAPLDIADAQIQIEKDPVYNGSVQTANITSVKMETLDVTYEVTEGNSGINADIYTLKIKGTGNYTGTAEVEWKIEKAVLTITAVDKEAYVGKTAPDLSNPIPDQDYTITGFVGNDVLEEGVSLVLTYADDLNMSQSGRYEIIPAVQGADSRYDFVFVNGFLTVSIEPEDENGNSISPDHKADKDNKDNNQTNGDTGNKDNDQTNGNTGSSTNASQVNTGDYTSVELWLVILVISGVLAVIERNTKKKRIVK